MATHPKIPADAEPWLEALHKLARRVYEVGQWRDAIDAALADPAGAALAVELRAGCDHQTRDRLQAAAQVFKAASDAGDPEAKAAAKEAMDGAATGRVEYLRGAMRRAWERHHGRGDDWDGGQQALDFAFWTMQAERRAVLGAWVKPSYGSSWPRCRCCGRAYRRHHLRPERRGDGRCWRCVAEELGTVAAKEPGWIPHGAADGHTAVREHHGGRIYLLKNRRQLRALANEVMRQHA